MELKIGRERYAMLAKRDVRRNNSWAELLSHSLLTFVRTQFRLISWLTLARRSMLRHVQQLTSLARKLCAKVNNELTASSECPYIFSINITQENVSPFIHCNLHKSVISKVVDNIAHAHCISLQV